LDPLLPELTVKSNLSGWRRSCFSRRRIYATLLTDG
jgi:hypothetical protein